MLRPNLHIALSAFALLTHCAAARADGVRFIGSVAIDGAAKDRSGLPPTLLEDGVSRLDALNGIGSGMAYAGVGDRYLFLPDRGPNKLEYEGGKAVDNTTSYANRFQTLNVAVRPDASKPSGYSVTATHVDTTLLRNEQGEQYLGVSTALAASGRVNRRLDPEGIRIAPDGSIWISDEYGPHILHFDQTGRQIGRLALPDGFETPAPAQNGDAEMANAKSGRVTNRGAEGLALTPDGRTLVIAMQSALVQDGGLKGLSSRILVYDLQTPERAPKQFLYPLKDAQHSISEILAVDGRRFLIDERDGKPGPKSSKLLYLVNFAQTEAPTDLAATPYSGRDGKPLPNAGAPDGIVPLKKTLLADVGALLTEATRAGLGALTTEGGVPDKIEGYAFGPTLPNGDFLLLACNDNDFAAPGIGFPNYIFAFAVSPSALPGVTLNRLNAGVKFGG